ncbi:uncharacterized protein TEOVI_000322300 [Trypanosoma equiperdum]|uniref:Uncharacterized protein n=2 Tax=Trypanozoon TaxID=39700 RepID=Q389Q1_TRYB2|nr:hypothetical protein, conserved [Trypanosoma brucei brucei TREU927]EAN78469.1 hypothetical protein, conserved [Trypanosoma brucei brucei TREU927]SCU71642.1 hypothetical protein, conserved [Trypanosoma equiperdum]
MRNSLRLRLSSTSSSLLRSTFWLRQCGSGGCGFSGGPGGYPTDADALAKILTQAKKGSFNGSSSSPSDFFDGRFVGGSPTMDPAMLQDMHQKLNQSLTPEVRESMKAMMESIQRGDGMPQMGMMAFGVGENEKGKKVARGAKLMFDPSTGKLSKDFVEKQLEDDDPVLPKETVGDYNTEGAIEVEFEEDARKEASVRENIPEAEVIVEEVPREK